MEVIRTSISELSERVAAIERGQNAAGVRIQGLEASREASVGEHSRYHEDLGEVRAAVVKLNEIVDRRGVDLGAGPTGKETRMRLDKMVEAKTTIEPYESITKSSQSFKPTGENSKIRSLSGF